MFNYKVRSIFYVRLSISSRTISAETMRTPVFLKYAKVCTFSIINSNFCVGNYVFAFIHLVPHESCNLIVCACVVLFAIYKCHLFINVILKYLWVMNWAVLPYLPSLASEKREIFLRIANGLLSTPIITPTHRLMDELTWKSLCVFLVRKKNISRDFQQNDFAAFSWTTVDLF